MFTTLTGAAIYALALFPGIAFAFAREGHQPVGRRSAVRELAGIVLVSAVCDVAISMLLIAISFFVSPLATRHCTYQVDPGRGRLHGRVLPPALHRRSFSCSPGHASWVVAWERTSQFARAGSVVAIED